MIKTAWPRLQVSPSDRSALRPSRLLRSAALQSMALLLAVGFSIPFIWAVLSSLKAADELYLFPPRWLPAAPQWSNYLQVWLDVPFGRFYLNTILITVVATLGEVMSCVLVAYGFARFRFPGRNALFIMVIATLILPSEVTIIPRFIMFKQVGWLDTFMPLTVPSFFATSAFAIFLLRQFILTLPTAYDEAAEIDGASSLRVLIDVLLPMMQPALITVMLFAVLGHWNDFMAPLIYLRSTLKFTLSVGLRYFQAVPQQADMPKEALLMAASLMATVPCVALFLVAQRQFVRGVVMSGLKG